MALKTLIALTEIVMGIEPGKPGDKAKGIRPVRPKTKTIAAGTVFKAPSAESEKELIDMKAAREAKKDDMVPNGTVVETAEKPEPAKKATGGKKAAEKADDADSTVEGGDGKDMV